MELEPAHPQTARFPDFVFRVGRRADPTHFSEIDALDAELRHVGNRFDVVGGGVLYCSTNRIGAFKEVLEDYRPASSSASYEAASGEHLMRVGSIPASWRDKRVLAQFSLTQPLPFLDVERDETLTFLTRELGDELESLGYSRLDSSHVRGPDRLLTRLIATWTYTQVDENDEAVYGGIRYSSRFQSHECWAVFEGSEVGNATTTPITREDIDLQEVARAFGLTIH